MIRRTLLTFLLTLTLSITVHVQSALPSPTLGFQGQLYDNGLAPTGTVGTTFTFYDALIGGSATGTTIPKTITVVNGYFGTQFTPSDTAGVDFNQQLYLEVSINGTVLSPRSTITPAASSLKSFGTFSYATPPAVGPSGSLYFNTTTGELYVSTGSMWQLAGTASSTIQWTPNGTSLNYMAGNVGIGTSTPTDTLSVAGSLNLTGALKSNGDAGTAGMILQTTGTGVQWVSTSTLNIPSISAIRNLFSSSATGLDYATSTGVFSITSGYNIPLTASSTNWNNFYNTPSTQITAGTNLSWSGNTLNAIVSTSGINYLRLVSGGLETSTTTDFLRAAYFVASSTTGISTFANAYFSGNVGIGTNSPTYKLQVIGDAIATRYMLSGSHFIASPGPGRINFNTGSSPRMEISNAYVNLGVGVSLGWGNSNASTNSDTSMYRDSAGVIRTPGNMIFDGSVGIGTANPSTKLDIAGSGTGGNLVELLRFTNDPTYFSSLKSSTGGSNGQNKLGFYITKGGTETNPLLLTDNLNIITGTTTISGNVGIGTISPTYKIDISESIQGGDFVGIRTRNSSNSANSRASIGFTVSSADVLTGEISNFKEGGGAVGLVFSTYNNSLSEKMRISPSGNVGIGTTTPTSKLTVVGDIQSTSLLGGITTLSVDANGNIIRTPSDLKLKTNIETITSALEKVNNMRGVSYNWLDTSRFGPDKEIGFIAQELETVVPEVVKSGGEYKSVNYQNLVALLVEAIKELSVKVQNIAVWFTSDKTFTVHQDSKFQMEGQMCADDICITKEQFKNLLRQASQNGGLQQNPPPVITPPPTPDTDSTGSTTEDAIEDNETEPAVDPEIIPIPEPVAESTVTENEGDNS